MFGAECLGLMVQSWEVLRPGLYARKSLWLIRSKVFWHAVFTDLRTQARGLGSMNTAEIALPQAMPKLQKTLNLQQQTPQTSCPDRSYSRGTQPLPGWHTRETSLAQLVEAKCKPLQKLGPASRTSPAGNTDSSTCDPYATTASAGQYEC